MIGFRCALTIDDKAWDLYGAMDINGKKFICEKVSHLKELWLGALETYVG